MQSNKKIGITTVFTGYNYGSSLQAFAVKKIIESLGYDAQLIGIKGSLFKGRDVRIQKTALLIGRTIWRPKALKQVISIYKKDVSVVISEQSRIFFNNFCDHNLQPEMMKYRQLHKRAFSDEYLAFICGSDQIWNSSTFYVDPVYYLRFAPIKKRIAFAPSFGRDYVPFYNEKIIAKNISEFACVSVREESGAQIVQTLVGNTPPVLMDPTLILTAEQWTELLQIDGVGNQEEYILLYFLNEPSVKALGFINEAINSTGLKVITLPYPITHINGSTECREAGPREFVSFIKGAKMVCTDSFHGTAFSLNFNVPFYTFERNYGNAEKQSTRILSLLHKVSLIDRYENVHFNVRNKSDFLGANMVLYKERLKALNYIQNAIDEVENSAKKYSI